MTTIPDRDVRRAATGSVLSAGAASRTCDAVPAARTSSNDRSAPAPNSFTEPLDDTNAPWPHRPCEVSTDEPSVARVYDAYLGGGHSFGADRAFAEQVAAIIPEVQALALANRRFLARAVRSCLARGIDQVIDIGAGIAADWSIHAAAHAVSPSCRVLYVDHEAVAVESVRAANGDDPRLGVLRADVREPEAIFGAPVIGRLLDLSRPIVIVMGLLLHFIPDTDNPADLLVRYREAIVSGSYLVISHDTADGREDDMHRVAALYAQANRPLVLRTRAELASLLDRYSLVWPGIVHLPLWRPADDEHDIGPPERACVYAVVARA